MVVTPPVSRPAIRAVGFDEVGAAIGRLLEVARADTGQSRRVADFLLAWWNGRSSATFRCCASATATQPSARTC